MQNLPEYYIRLIFFFLFTSIIITLEVFFPRRKIKKFARKVTNILLILVNICISRLLFPSAALGVAIWAKENNLGLFNQFYIDKNIVNVLTVIFLDFFIYWQHVIFHKVPWLWKLHQVHHCDDDFDFTTALRFHPLEIILSMILKSLLISAFGFSLAGVLAFEVILNGLAMFNHGNFKIPYQLDRVIRSVFVTPDMHRIHHSVISSEYNTNFGFNLSCWDRIFFSYKNRPNIDHEKMKIGLAKFSRPDQLKLLAILKMPFVK